MLNITTDIHLHTKEDVEEITSYVLQTSGTVIVNLGAHATIYCHGETARLMAERLSHLALVAHQELDEYARKVASELEARP